MNKNILDNLFNINVNTNRKGTAGELSTGLGLILCKDFIEKNNGTLRVESEQGIGSTFFFTLPARKEAGVLAGNTKPETTVTPFETNRNLSILIAEDDETSDLLISIALSKISNEIIHAKTGIEAVENCRIHPGIDLILMDIKMPEMDGLEATRQIRQFNPEAVIIAQTAFGQSGGREKALEAGCNYYIEKPIEVSMLLQLIKEHFRIS
jgi:CheY-like chemotaxis protein